MADSTQIGGGGPVSIAGAFTTTGTGTHSGTNTFTGALNLDGKVHYAHETKTSGALSLGTTISFLSINSSQSFSLADGTAEGEVKIVICTVGTSTPVGTLTPNATAGAYSTIEFSGASAVGQSVTLVWTGSGWAIVGRGSGAAAATDAVNDLPVIA